MNTKTAETDVKRDYVCAGRFISSKDNKVVLQMYPVDAVVGKTWDMIERDVDLKASCFIESKDTKRIRAGHVYTIPTRNEGKSFVFAAAKWLRQYEDEATALHWQVEEKAVLQALAAGALEKKMATGDSTIQRYLKPIREAYQRLPYSQRLAFELYVLSQLRKS